MLDNSQGTVVVEHNPWNTFKELFLEKKDKIVNILREVTNLGWSEHGVKVKSSGLLCRGRTTQEDLYLDVNLARSHAREFKKLFNDVLKGAGVSLKMLEERKITVGQFAELFSGATYAVFMYLFGIAVGLFKTPPREFLNRDVIGGVLIAVH